MMAASGVYLAGPRFVRAAVAPASRVAVSRCKTYEPSELLPTMQKMFDQLGGLGRLVKGKTVAIKINLTGAPTYRVGASAPGRYALYAPARHRGGRAPDGRRGRDPHPRVGEPLVHRRIL